MSVLSSLGKVDSLYLFQIYINDLERGIDTAQIWRTITYDKERDQNRYEALLSWIAHAERNSQQPQHRYLRALLGAQVKSVQLAGIRSCAMDDLRSKLNFAML
ncbi:MAG: hypothetical protein CV089_13480 [Nitrospira sp. WS110]|nr:hypothetical protein [Nitrospira sp. WS110]